MTSSWALRESPELETKCYERDIGQLHGVLTLGLISYGATMTRIATLARPSTRAAEAQKALDVNRVAGDSLRGSMLVCLVRRGGLSLRRTLQ